MKNIVSVMLFVLSFFVCSSKKSILNTVPVLMDYRLFYPDEALERGLEGKVIVSLIVTDEGKAKDVTIHESSGYYLLDSAAVRTANTFVFSPATLRNKPVKSAVQMPVEFILKNIDFETWIAEVKILQRKIERQYSKETIEELYNLYKKLIYSTRFEKDSDVNDYIKDAVLNSTGKLWEGYWSVYPGSIILFIDIVNRYPDSFMSLKAGADFNKFIKEEATRIRHTIPYPKSDTIINRLYNAMDI